MRVFGEFLSLAGGARMRRETLDRSTAACLPASGTPAGSAGVPPAVCASLKHTTTERG